MDVFIFNFFVFLFEFYYAVKDIFFFLVGGACNQSADAFARHAVARAALVAIFCFCSCGGWVENTHNPFNNYHSCIRINNFTIAIFTYVICTFYFFILIVLRNLTEPYIETLQDTDLNKPI